MTTYAVTMDDEAGRVMTLRVEARRESEAYDAAMAQAPAGYSVAMIEEA